jgi:hypothetical protein
VSGEEKMKGCGGLLAGGMGVCVFLYLLFDDVINEEV